MEETLDRVRQWARWQAGLSAVRLEINGERVLGQPAMYRWTLGLPDSKSEYELRGMGVSASFGMAINEIQSPKAIEVARERWVASMISLHEQLIENWLGPVPAEVVA